MKGQDDDLQYAAKYRQRAEELREIAESVDDEASRKTILEIAADYEKLARSRVLVDNILRQPSGT